MEECLYFRAEDVKEVIERLRAFACLLQTTQKMDGSV